MQENSICTCCGVRFINPKVITWDTDAGAERKKGDAPIYGTCMSCDLNIEPFRHTFCTSSQSPYLQEEAFVNRKKE